MPNPTGEPDSQPDTRPHIEGDAYFLFSRTPPPEIPPDKARPCPQCHHAAWADSRWCWNCKFDFDRAVLARCHPTKLLLIALAATNLVLAALLVRLLV